MARTVIFANGELAEPEHARRRLRPEDELVAADGGARHCLALGLIPRRVVGDLDSLPAAVRADLEAAGAQFEQYPPAKDETDLELALLGAAAAGAAEIVVLAALGGRLDMTLANLHLLAHPALAGVRVEFWHGAQTLWLIQPPGGSAAGQPGDTLSLIPLGGDAAGVTLAGLRYGLSDASLPFGPARGVSNVLTEPLARIELRAGKLLASHTPGRA